MKNKKAQTMFNAVVAGIFFFIVAGFLAAGGVLGLTAFGDSSAVLTPGSVNEENVTVSGVILNPEFSSFPYRLTSVSRVTNASGVLVAARLYNVTTGDAGNIKLSQANSSIYNVTYSFNANTVAANITRNSEVGIVNVTSLFGVIGILIGVAALLLVVLAFAPGTKLGRG